MSDELRECPFCGAAAKQREWSDETGERYIVTYCTNTYCGVSTEAGDVDWNRRPAEDAAASRIASLEADATALREALRQIEEWLRFSGEPQGRLNQIGQIVKHALSAALAAEKS